MGSDAQGSPVSIEVRAAGLRFRTLQWDGQPGRRPFVLLHGLASNARFWELVGDGLSAAGHPVFAPDLRGHGLSDKPDDGYDFATLSADVAALTEVFGSAAAIVAGHSWGGMIALDFATRNGPAGVALIDGGFTQASDYPGATWERAEQALTPPRLEGIRLEAFLERLASSRPLWARDDRLREIILGNFEHRPDGTIAPHLAFATHMRIVRHIWDHPTYDTLARVRCPVLMVAARPAEVSRIQDEVFLELKRRGQAQARRRLPGSTFVWMEETDHDIPLHRPAELVDHLLRFAGRVDRGE